MQVAKWGNSLAVRCQTLYSEELQDGQIFEGELTLHNLFIRSNS